MELLQDHQKGTLSVDGRVPPNRFKIGEQLRLEILKAKKNFHWWDLLHFRDIEDFGSAIFSELREISSYNHQNREFPIQRFEELSWNLPRKRVRQWESRDRELSETSEIIKIGPIMKKLWDSKVG